MAKVLFHKGQRVYVKSVGAWAVVERVIPQWVKGVEEPLKVLYDVGFGREFQGSELVAEAKPDRTGEVEAEIWRILRMRNRMTLEQADERHPYPGTFPVVVTDELDWGGWRVPAAEYERDPERIEHQARVIVNALRMLRVIKTLAALAEDDPGAVPAHLADAAKAATAILTDVYQPDAEPEAPAPTRR